MIKESLKTGINLGGWISQYKEFDHDHFKTFITEEDIRKIAGWGFDHIRLPIDYPVLEEDANPGVYLESGFAYLDNCLKWCQDHGLRLIFDIHRAPGYSFTNTLEAEDTGEINTLFTEPAMQQRFIDLWDAITHRYLGQADDMLAFELLNEMVLPESTPWNKLAQRIIDQIRKTDAERLIIIGGNYYNAVTELKNIEVKPDFNLLYTFHFYEPMVVTHQKAYWVLEMDEFDYEMHYPGKAQGLEEFIRANHPHQVTRYEKSFDRMMDRDFLKVLLTPAAEFIQKTDQPLYCGEFGVIDKAPMQTRVNWNRDFIDILNEYKIRYGYWSYKEMDFGLVDNDGKVINEELLKVISQQG